MNKTVSPDDGPREERKVTLNATWYYSQAEVVTMWKATSPGGLCAVLSEGQCIRWGSGSGAGTPQGLSVWKAGTGVFCTDLGRIHSAQAPFVSVHSSRISRQQQETTALYLGGI